MRTLLHSTLRYHIKNLKAKYPDVDIILIQPEWDDERMFSHYPMHFGSRLALAEHGFSTVTNGLMQRLDYYQQILDRHGIALKPSIVERKFGARQLAGQDREQRTIEQRLLLVNSAVSQQSGNGEISFDLQSSLTRLEQNLSRLERLLEKSH